MSKKKKTIILCSVLIVLAILAYTIFRFATRTPYGKESASVITEKEVTKAGDVLRAAEISNVELFETWVYEYHENRDKDYQSDAYSDADSLITAMLLLDDQISCDGTEEYKGESLASDIALIEKEGVYTLIRDNLPVFTTLFGEAPIPESGIEHALPDKWKKHGVKVFNDYASLVSVVYKAHGADEVYTGHAGVLVDCSKTDSTGYENYLFVEKLGFGDAFMATEISDPEDLTDLFSHRSGYGAPKGEPKPLVYMNDKLLGELK